MFRLVSLQCIRLAIVVSGFAPVFVHAELKWDALEYRVPASEPAMSVAHEFKGTNASTKTVRILELKPSCKGCVTVSADRMKIEPGQTAKITVKMDRKGRAAGQVEWVLIKADDGNETRVFMRVAADNKLTVRPPFVWWKRGEEKASKEMVVEAQDGSAGVKALDVSSSSKNFDVQVVTEIQGKRFRVQLTPKETDAPGVTTFTITSDVPKDKPAKVLGYAKIL